MCMDVETVRSFLELCLREHVPGSVCKRATVTLENFWIAAAKIVKKYGQMQKKQYNKAEDKS